MPPSIGSASGRSPGSARWHAGSADGRRSRAAGRAGSAPRPPPACARGRSCRGRGSRRAACACRDGCGARTACSVGASSTIRPRYITPTRSATWRTTARLWRDEEIGQAERRCRSFMRLRICACTETSSAEVGSSHTRNSGSLASARAIEMRWRWPPENSCGYLPPSAGVRPTWRSSSPTRFARSASSLARPKRAERLGDDVAHAPARVEAGVRVLEDHLHAPAQWRPCRRGCAGRPCRRRRTRSRPRSARTGRRAGAPPSTCRSPTRRPARRSRPGDREARRRRPRCTIWRGLPSSTRSSQGARDVEVSGFDGPRS